MSEPTLVDVLDAIAKLDTRLEKVETRIEKVDVKMTSEFADVRRDAVRAERARHAFEGQMDDFRDETKHAIEDLSVQVDTRFDRVDKAIASLAEDLDEHMKVHRELEKDIETLKRRPPRTAARPARRR